ncbi:hypothetical protein GXN76_05905 [Kroppenstedtia pulmonis]|uniref:General stress protein 17M-like domain-containing protein n=1 Tax=Kroppenstedtia pulmonis TaxID=1380685 RepID=A0A7D4BVL0_9BACL|nr:hypothetical protein [Kroppenstedtia pulmonis]QKG84053.1 hypothetical protein GXN76_05905 [Kroppenstedtia pulmonis]
MGRRNILSYFSTEKQAKEAVKNLKANGFETVDLSRFSLTPGGDASDLDNPISEPLSSLVSGTGGNVSGRDAGILQAVSVESSGMADGSHQWGAEDLCVTVVTDDEHYDKAITLLEQAGARI